MIVNLLSKELGISQREISRRLNRAPSTINYNVRFLVGRNLLLILRTGGVTKCYVK